MNRPSILVISGHDYRSKRRVNIHFIARALMRYGRVNFYSVGFSQFSRAVKDTRLNLWNRSNRVEEFEGVQCFLERTLFHPVNTHQSWLAAAEVAWFSQFEGHARPQFWEWVKEAEIILMESGLSVLFIERVRNANPHARIIYLASDDLATIGCSDYLRGRLLRTGAMLNYAVLPSRLLTRAIPEGLPWLYVPHGFDRESFSLPTPSPYRTPQNAMSVGSMLFDASFFAIACAAFPQVTFHIIGGGRNSARVKARNVIVYPEMNFSATVPYIQHATIGIAPYAGAGAAYYLSETSMKLMQYEYVGLNVACPVFASGKRPGRFGYNPGDARSIVQAVQDALSAPRFAPDREQFLTWDQVVDRILVGPEGTRVGGKIADGPAGSV